jgi:hypothetical protein
MGIPMPAEALHILLWGFVATAVLTTILEGSQGVGLSRLSLPFLLGMACTGRRDAAMVLGVVLYLLGGWIFAALYYLLFLELGRSGVWIGGLVGALHGAVLLVVVLPVLPFVHPRMASEHDGPADRPRLQPPGFLGLHYGYRTPLTTLVGHIAYGAVVGGGLSVSSF